MIPIIYHTGLTPPPSLDSNVFEIYHYPVLKVEYESSNIPCDISDFLQMDPIVLIMSKNAVIGLNNWLESYGKESNFFSCAKFWTIGDRTNQYLQNALNIQSFYPEEMTGKGVLLALQEKDHSKVLLVSGQNPRKEFIEDLNSAGINFFHFSVYKIKCEGNTTFSANFINNESNYLVITSPSSIVGILKSLSLLDLSNLKTRIISIGPTTSAAICENGGDIFLESKVQNINLIYENLWKSPT